MNYESKISGEDLDVSTMDDDNIPARNKRRLIIIGAIVAAIILAIIAYKIFAGGGEDAAADAASSQAPAITVIVPGKQEVVRTINATGTVAARRELPIGVVGEGGRVTQVYVDAGDWVKAGQVMARIDRSVQTQ